MLCITPREPALDAAMATIGLALLVRHHAHHLFAAQFRAKTAPYAAIGAGRDDRTIGRSDIDHCLFDKRRSRTSLNAGAARHAFGAEKIFGGQPCRYARIPAPPLHGERKRALDFVARADTARAQDAFAGIKIEIGVRLVLWLIEMIRLCHIPDLAKADCPRLILKFAIPVRCAGQAIERVIRNVELHHALAQFLQEVRLRPHDHAGFDRGRATRGSPLSAVDFDKAQPTRSEAFEAVCRAQFWNCSSDFCCRTHHTCSFGNSDALTVDRQRDHHARPAGGRSEIGLRLIRHAPSFRTKSSGKCRIALSTG